MYSPILVTPPAMTPISVADAKVHLRQAEYDASGAVIAGDDDALISAFIDAAVSCLDGWTGILGRCLVEQSWRQDFDSFAGCLRLPLAPALGITSVVATDADGAEATVPDTAYSLLTDALGPFVRLNSSFVAPYSLADAAGVSVTFTAGYATIPEVAAVGETAAIPAQSTVPAAIKVAILLLVGDWYNNREASMPGTVSELPFAVNALISPFRRISI
ncbi:MAG: head-tail connector protein [Devosia sp.]